MYWFRTASKVLVWVLASLVPLQGIDVLACCCTAQAKVAADAEGTSLKHRGSCSCRQQASPPAEPSAASHSCCQRVDSGATRTCSCCEADCQCKKGDSSPRQKQIPSENRSPATDLTDCPLVVFCLECSDPQTMETQGRKVSSLSGADRCILLCRFHL